MHRIFACLLLLLSSMLNAAPVADWVRVLKSERKLQVLAQGRVLYEFSIALGSNPVGHKTQEGDGKTPEGRYTLDYKKADSAYYKAIHISYPNAQDSAAAQARGVRPGGQIMIHGQKNGLGHLAAVTQRFDWTIGCIALSNEDMDLLWSVIQEGTPIEITP